MWAVPTFAAEPILVGIIDKPQCGDEKSETSARVLFHKEGRKWRALGVSGNNKPSTNWDINSINWTIALDGKNLGTIKIEEPPINKKFRNDFFYRRDKLHNIKAVSDPPKIENKSNSFSGWCGAPDVLPLVIISKPNFNDPEKWKPFNPTDEQKKKLFPYLKIAVGKRKLLRCLYEPEYHSVPYDFKYTETVLHKSYRSARGRDLISIQLDIEIINCDGPPYPEWYPNWFLTENDNVDFLGRQMELIDAGDYDNDGNSELLFWYSGYNRDGYVLIYNDFNESAEYIWGYH